MLYFGPTEKEKREKASQEAADILGARRESAPSSLKNREFWALCWDCGGTAEQELTTAARDLGLIPRAPLSCACGRLLAFNTYLP